jgi:O-antigen/teichoic acid export membrane protein
MAADEGTKSKLLFSVAAPELPAIVETGDTPQDQTSQSNNQMHAGPLAHLTALYRATIASDFFRKVTETYVTQISLIVVGVATTVVVARILGPEGRGFLAVAVAISGLGVQFGNLGLNVSNTYYVAKDRSLLPKLLGNTLVISLGLIGIGAFTVYLFLQGRPQWTPVHGNLLILVLAWVPFGLAYMLLQNLLLGVQEVRAYNKIELISKLLALVFIGFILLSGSVSPVTVLLAFFVALLISFIWAFWRLYGLLHQPLAVSVKLFWSNIRLGIKAYFVCLFGFMVLKSDILLIKHFVGVEDAGYYSVATAVSGYLATLPIVVAAILFPTLSAMTDVEERLRMAKRAAMGTGALLGLLLLFASFSAKLIVRVLFGKAFLPAATAFIWLAPGALFLGVEAVIVQFLNSFGYPKSIVGVWFAVVVLNVGANLIAIPRYGIVGAAAVSSLSYLAVFLAILGLIRGHNSKVIPVSSESQLVHPGQRSL